MVCQPSSMSHKSAVHTQGCASQLCGAACHSRPHALHVAAGQLSTRNPPAQSIGCNHSQDAAPPCMPQHSSAGDRRMATHMAACCQLLAPAGGIIAGHQLTRALGSRHRAAH
jgi:hypothetical protein